MRKYLYLLIALFAFSASACKDTPQETNPPAITYGVDIPPNAMDGVTYIKGSTSAILNLYAPDKKTVSVIGGF
jgi:hypothetical protein